MAFKKHANDSAELIALKKEAKELGLELHHAAGVKRHIEVIGEYHAKNRAGETRTIADPAPTMPSPIKVDQHAPAASAPIPMTDDEFQLMQGNQRKKDINRLVRIRIQCMNPLKKEWPGEIISVGSAKMGTFKKFIPFTADEPYHIPQIMYEELMSRKCTVFTTKSLPNGQKVRKGKLIAEFAIEVLAPLTAAEIKDLAQRQAMAAGQDVA